MGPETSVPELVEFLTNPASFDDGTTALELKETHISWVVLTKHHAYKLKKPVQFPFLDYSSVELRHQACQDEIRLGNRLAPGVYLKCVTITRGPNGRLQLGGHGDAVDYCVLMKRLPANRTLDRLIAEHAASREDIARLLDVLVPFYEHAERGPEIDRHATADAIWMEARENVSTIESTENALPPTVRGSTATKQTRPDTTIQPPLSGHHGDPIADILPRVRASQYQFIHLRSFVFRDRIHDGRVCDGHGDLRPEHVCMIDPPVVFDCVEFSLPFRAADVASELAFLAMECDFLGAPDLGNALIACYRERTEDKLPEALVSFYRSYRACVRAKVELLRASQLDEQEAIHSHLRARRYLQLASYYATDFYRPKLFVTVGAAGTGKSTIACAIADNLGLVVLRSDAIRHEMAGHREPDAGYGQGIYNEAMNEKTYETMFERAQRLLAQAHSVVLDGTFRDVRQRNRATQLARQFGADVHFLLCHCPGDVARQRITDRVASGRDISDARPEIFTIQEKEIESATDWAARPPIVLDTSKPVAQLVSHILAEVGGPGQSSNA